MARWGMHLPGMKATRLACGQLGQAGRLMQSLVGHPPPRPAPPHGARFLDGRFEGGEGRLDYKLYVPARRPGPAPLLVMLHGCTQSPDDFALGTRMNQLAEERGWLVLYPAQSRLANPQACWNWFKPEHQSRTGGEPALIAGAAQQAAGEWNADPGRTYVAGLSAGGAMAAILGLLYPDRFAAIGIHSGLAGGAARDLPSAMAAMRGGGGAAGRAAHAMPTIVFHADADATVHPSNAECVLAQFMRPGLRPVRKEGRARGGHAWRRTAYLDSGGRTALEDWLVRGGGHAWSGGDPAGSYADPRGPDASREMLRFFALHARAPG